MNSVADSIEICKLVSSAKGLSEMLIYVLLAIVFVAAYILASGNERRKEENGIRIRRVQP